MAKLDSHRDEILGLLEEGMSQAEVIRHFEGRGIKVSRSTLSDFVRQQQEGDMATAVMEDEGLSERMAAALSFQRSTADELIDKMIDLAEAVQQLKTEGDEHHKAVLAAIGKIEMPSASSAEDIRALLETATARLDRLAARTGEAGLRWVWLKALSITGLAWGVMLAGWLYGTGFLSRVWAILVN
jgi:hypothetical protein